MKTHSSLVIAAVCGLISSSAFAANNSAPAAPAAGGPPPSAAAPSAPAKPSAPAADAKSSAVASDKTAGVLADSKATEKAVQQHIRPADPFTMPTPPPPARAETRTEPPAAVGYVWVPGHWTPVKGEWQWTAGTWGVPATPSSIWIPAKYDDKSKHWSAGYWQPDRPAAPEPQLPTKETATATPAASPY